MLQPDSVVIVGSYVQCHIPGLMMISNPKHAAITYAPQYRGGMVNVPLCPFPWYTQAKSFEVNIQLYGRRRRKFFGGAILTSSERCL